MFNRILIAEDFDSYNMAIKTMIEELKINTADQVYYCDDAFNKIKSSYLDNKPYQLLITDLSFTFDDRKQILKSGEELIKSVNLEFPDLKIIIFSIENREYKIKRLFERYNIHGFVIKGRGDIKELKKVIQEVHKGKITYPDISIHKNTIYEFTEYDIKLVTLLSKGMTISDVASKLKKDKTMPNSKSYVEKRIAILREKTDSTDTKQLVFFFTENGLLE